ncbi:MAG: pilus assembly protein TadG-related protein [Candidatus Limnocylindrales bacterium]
MTGQAASLSEPSVPESLSGRRARRRPKGQVLVIFAGAIFVLIGMVAIVVDVSWYWANTLRVQRAADAAALAGAIYLPGSTTNAYAYAKTEASKNGYTTGGGTVVTPLQDTSNGGTDPRQLDVTISAPVQTFFMRIFGLNTITATRTSKAIYVQPVPMGSPENYYGVYCLVTPKDGNCDSSTAVPDASGLGTLASKGFWGAFQTSGDPHNEGDAFMPLNDPLHPGTNAYGGTNPDYDPAGYNYAVVVPAAGGSVYVFDPTFCAVGGGLGTGDHFNGGALYSVTSYYNLYNTNNTPWISDDTLVSTSGSMFQKEFQFDNSGTYGTVSGIKVGDTSTDGKKAVDCAAGKIVNSAVGGYWHDKWWPMATGLAAGTYRLQIQSAAVSDSNFNAHAENAWSIEVTGPKDGLGNTPHVYGIGRMAGYNILASGLQAMYLAQIDQTAAGKTIEIDLFDPGDVSGNAFLRVLSPDGGAYNYATFSYTSDSNCVSGSSDACSATGRTSVQTAKSGSSSFNDTWLKIQVALPPTYGSVSLTPSGETQPGWWKIEYQVAGGNDTTTWMVNVLGNPVHLVVP